MLCALARKLKGAGQTFDETLEALMRRYGYTLDELHTFPARDTREFFESLRRHPPEALCGVEVAVQDGPAGLCLTGGGIKATVRASGTEPKLKAYLSASGQDERDARLKLRTLAGDVTRWIQRHQNDREPAMAVIP